MQVAVTADVVRFEVVLRRLGQRLRSRFHDEEVLARIGGEEFAVVIPEISPERSVEVAEELRELVCQSPVETSRGSVKVTISVGVAHFDGQGSLSSGQMMLRADRMLYDAKRAGRNCVRI